MPVQRACAAEKQTGNSLSRKVWLCVIFSRNGPLRVQGTAENFRRTVFCNVGHTSVAGDVLASRQVHGVVPMKSGWHRGSKAKLYSSLTEEGFFCQGRFSFTLLRQKTGGVFCLTQKGGAAMKIRPALDEVKTIAAAGGWCNGHLCKAAHARQAVRGGI